MDKSTTLFEQNRATLEGIAYRMLGSLSEAQDVVQDVYLKWREQDVQDIQNARAWLVKVCSRLSLNVLQSARATRETYPGTWLPEPLVQADQIDDTCPLELDESVSIALLVSLETLSPKERAAYILREVFQYNHSEIADILALGEGNCRQLVSRARKRLNQDRPKFVASPEEHRNLLDGFLEAAREGNMQQFKRVLNESIQLYADGGGKVETALNLVAGRIEVGEFFATIWSDYALRRVRIETKKVWFNGSPGLLIYEDDCLATAMTIDIVDSKIHRLYAIRNPDKLATFQARS